MSLRGLRVGTPGGAISIAAGNTLTLGSGGIDMVNASRDLRISSGLTIGTGAQFWTVTTGRTLTLDTGTFTRSAGASLSLQGAGTVAASMTGLANTNGIIGPGPPWEVEPTQGMQPCRQVTSLGFTGTAVAAATLTSPGDAAVNYEITTAGTGAYGVSRNGNTFRLTAGATTITMGNAAGQINLTTNGIMNAGTGLLTITSGGTNAASGIQIGSSRELVVNAANAGINLGRIINNGANVSSVTVVSSGANSVTFSGTNTFTGDLVVNGALNAGVGQGATPTASSLGALQPTANRNIVVNNGGVLTLTTGNVLGTGGSTNTLSNTTLVVNQGGLFSTGLDGAGAGWWNKIGATNLNGGTIRVGSGANTGVFQGLALIGTVTVGETLSPRSKLCCLQ